VTTPICQGLARLPVEAIEVQERLRPVSAKAVEGLVASIRENGHILSPILVQKVRGGGYRLIDGAHRLAAAKALGLAEVPVSVFECGVDQALRMEVDGNMAGAPMSALDMAVFLAARKRLYEKEHPEARRGLAGARGRWHATVGATVASFAATAAEALGKSELTIFRLVAVGERLEAEEVARLRAAARPVRFEDLQALAKIGQTAERVAVVDLLAAGEARTAAAARALVAAREGRGPQPSSRVEAAFKALCEAWLRAPKAARRRFVEHRFEDVEDLYHETVARRAGAEEGEP
jgi:ParB family chromosome partitioning protein